MVVAAEAVAEAAVAAAVVAAVVGATNPTASSSNPALSPLS